MLLAECLLRTGLCLALTAGVATAQDNSKDKPSDRWPASTTKQDPNKVEPGTVDVKKLTDAVAELKARVDQIEATLAPKAEYAKMADIVKQLGQRVERMQDEMLAMRNFMSPITPAGASVPKTVAPEEARRQKQDNGAKLDAIMQKLDDLSRLKQQVESQSHQLNDMGRTVTTLQQDVILAQNKADKVEQDVSRLRTQLEMARSPNGTAGSDRRISSALPLPPDTAATSPAAVRPATYGTVRLVNSYLTPVSVVLDGRLYTIPNNQSMDVPHTAGYFTYEVMGIQPNTLRTLNAGETMTIQIVPR